MKTHKSVKEREAGWTPWDAKSEPNLLHKQTQAQKVSEKERRSHFLLTCKRDWCGYLCEWVCHAWQPVHPDADYFSEFMRSVSSRAISYSLELRRSIHICEQDSQSNSTSSHRSWASRQILINCLQGKLDVHGTRLHPHPTFCATRSSTFTQSVLLTLSALLLQSVTDVYLQKAIDNNKEKWITAQVRLYLTWNNVSLRVRNCFLNHFDATNKWNTTI